MSAIDRLSLTETAVVCGWAKGLDNRQVAVELALSLHTVRELAKRIRGKLGVPTRAGAVAIWERYCLEADLESHGISVLRPV